MQETITIPAVEVSAVLYFVGGMFILFMGMILLILWRVESFLKRCLIYIKANSAASAENIISPKEEVPPAPEGETILRALQDAAYKD